LLIDPRASKIILPKEESLVKKDLTKKHEKEEGKMEGVEKIFKKGYHHPIIEKTKKKEVITHDSYLPTGGK